MGKEALSIGANTFQFFTRNPRGSKAKEIDEKDVAAFREFAEENGIGGHSCARALYAECLFQR